MMRDIPNIDDVVHELSVAVDDMDWMDGAVCCFDADFPVINESAPKGPISCFTRVTCLC